MLSVNYLHGVHFVSIVTYQPGELDLSDLLELLESEAAWPSAILVPEPITETEVVELFANQAGKGRSDHGTGQRNLGNTS